VNLRTHSEAEGEAQIAALRYEAKRTGLGDAFLDELADTLQHIEMNPRGYGKVPSFITSREIRFTILKRFPYKVIYEVLTSEVVVLAIAHASRRPYYWRRRDSSSP
jgi:toxin ParE1/3/4